MYLGVVFNLGERAMGSFGFVLIFFLKATHQSNPKP